MIPNDSRDDSHAGALTLALWAAGLAAPRRAEALRGLIAPVTAERDLRPELLPEARALLRLEPGDDRPDFLVELGSALATGLRLELIGCLDESRSIESAATALLVAILGHASAADPGIHWFHYWSSETLRHGLPRSGPGPGGARIRREVEERITLGINLRGRSDLEFLAAQKRVDHHDADPSSGPALDALRALLAASSFCGGDLPRALRLTASGEGVVVAKAMTLGLLAGAYYGLERLREEWPEFG